MTNHLHLIVQVEETSKYGLSDILRDFKKFTAQQIAEILDGDVVGNTQAEVSKLSKIEEGTAESLTFLANPKYTAYIYSTNATITIVNKSFEPEKEIKTTLILTSPKKNTAGVNIIQTLKTGEAFS